MSWESRLFDLFDDLEQQAEALHLAERDAEVAELARAEYAEVALASRVHASCGLDVELAILGGTTLRGRLARAGRDWCLVAVTPPVGQVALIPLRAVVAVRGLSARAVPEAARPLPDRLGMGSVLRRLAEDGEPVVVLGTDGSTRHGAVQRVGADFLELAGDSGTVVVPFGAVALLRT